MTIDCLKSLAPEITANPGVSAFVIENGSEDNSAEIIAEFINSNNCQDWCSLIISERNRGFAGGNNLGIEKVIASGGANYYLLLNSDTVVEPGCLKHCLRVMDSDLGIGAMSCRLLNVDRTIQNVCRRFPTPLRCTVSAFSLPWRLPRLFSWADCEDMGWDRNTVACDVDWIGGAFMFIRGDWIACHRGFDERFFFYGEDIELCHRIQSTGFRCHYDPGSTVVHFGGASSDPGRLPASSRSFHRWRGRYLVQQICYGDIAKLFLQLIDIFTVLRRIILRMLMGRTKAAEYLEMREVLLMLMRNWRKWSGPHI